MMFGIKCVVNNTDHIKIAQSIKIFDHNLKWLKFTKWMLPLQTNDMGNYTKNLNQNGFWFSVCVIIVN